mmetsp:Transcript_1232/g.2624  ORF Transcript_1232/g.2624 Transcript_1232/m.2624 type:complete len:1164 (-) Transcript_1232:2091-5582(-)
MMTAGEVCPTVLPVRVAVHARPLLDFEVNEGCSSIFSLDEELNTVQVNNSTTRYTFDYVINSLNPGSDTKLYQECVLPLVEGCFDGLNATVLAYGQTGSGKTYTMGTTGGSRGVIPRVAKDLFERARALPGDQGPSVCVSFFEIYCEDLFDLLSEKVNNLHVREDGTTVFVSGLTEIAVKNESELIQQLELGCKRRATGSTKMNQTSSRSHAIFTVSISREDTDSGVIQTSKFHLVDLAGSERAKKTGAVGDRFKEGVEINKGLSSLGNVISILGNPAKERSHVPYRNSKLTRILQDSLGGNSRTVMIACISPADINFDETLNTLRYANRARNIQNKPVTNNEYVNGGSSTLIANLQRENAQLKEQLAERCIGGVVVTRVKEKTDLLMRLSEKNCDLETLIEKIKACVESNMGDVDTVRQLLTSTEGDTREEKSDVETPIDRQTGEEDRTEAQKENEDNHVARQFAFQKELQELDEELEYKVGAVKKLEASEAQWETKKEYYVKLVEEMCKDLDVLQQERDDLLQKLDQGSNSGTHQEVALKEKLRLSEEKIKSLSKKQKDLQRKLGSQGQTKLSLERLTNEIQSMKRSRVALLKRMKEESEQFRRWKKGHEKQVKQLEKQETRQRLRYMNLERKHEKQQNVLNRKREEAAAVQRRLKELLAKQKEASSKWKNNHVANKQDFEKQFVPWLNQQLQVSCALLSAKQALKQQEERRKELALLGDDTDVNEERRLCNERMQTLIAVVSDAEEANHAPGCGKRRWDKVNHPQHAKQCLRLVYRELLNTRQNLASSNKELELLREDLEEMEDALHQAEHQHAVELAKLERNCADQIMLALGKHEVSVDEAYEQRIQLLEEENAKLLKSLSDGSYVAKAKKKDKKKAVANTYEEEEEIWFSDSSISSNEDQSDDEDWTEDTVTVKRSRKSGSSTTSPSNTIREAAVSNNPENISNENLNEVMAKLPPDLVSRIEALKVKDLKDALFHLSLAISGRKDVLKARLYKGLVEKQATSEGGTLLPEKISSRHETSVQQIDNEINCAETARVAENDPGVTNTTAREMNTASSKRDGLVERREEIKNNPAVMKRPKVDKMVKVNSNGTVVLKRPKNTLHNTEIPTKRPKMSTTDIGKENSMRDRLAKWHEQKDKKDANKKTAGPRKILGVIHRNK